MRFPAFDHSGLNLAEVAEFGSGGRLLLGDNPVAFDPHLPVVTSGVIGGDVEVEPVECIVRLGQAHSDDVGHDRVGIARFLIASVESSGADQEGYRGDDHRYGPIEPGPRCVRDPGRRMGVCRSPGGGAGEVGRW
ncbi:hypothetical protein [Nocardia cyriacigeorgica]|uniref:hypothetical protein n=1 Tax=Nocardia cyriacigeorgica TaxID=135487 RepID=UPI002456AAAB|nr:hypothetical protein [Nocardia cyriacigeorgica]